MGCCEINSQICLQTLHKMHSKNSFYEPEIFPGLKYKMSNPKVTLVIFKSGKIIVTGGKSESDITDAVANVTKYVITSNCCIE